MVGGNLTGEVPDFEAQYRAWQARSRERSDLSARVRDQGRQLYGAPEGPALRDSVAAFVDELGFSKRVETLSSVELRRDIEIYDDARARLSNPRAINDEDLRVLFFSDNVGLAKPIGPTFPVNDLVDVLRLLADYQLNMTLNNRFVRGGVTRGELYADHSWITGDALVKAYELESKIAVFPRVLIDQGCQALALQDFVADFPPAFTIRLSDAHNLLLRDGDQVILSYLGLLLMDDYIDLPIDVALETHRRQITSNLSQNLGSHIRKKYEWVAAYHDFFVTQVLWHPEYIIGGQHTPHFASFNQSWMSDILGPSVATRLLVDNFETLCANADTAYASEVHEPLDLESSPSETRSLVQSIDYNCSVLLAIESVADEKAAIENIVAGTRAVLKASQTPPPARIGEAVIPDLTDCLWVLDKGLRVLRIDPRSDKLAMTGLRLASQLLELTP